MRRERSELPLLFSCPATGIKIKSFRAVTARATFLCLCKETWRKETHPAFAPGAAHRVRGAGGIFRGGILPPRKTPHIHVRRPAGLVRRLRRYGGGPKVKIKSQSQSQSQKPKPKPKPCLPQTCKGGGKAASFALALVGAASAARS